MYRSKQLLPSRSRLKIKALFKMRSGLVYIEFGYSQNVNTQRNYKQMFQEAILNAFYKVNHRTGDTVFNKDNYAEDLSKYVQEVRILEHDFSYYEDRLYGYKRENIKGKYSYVIRRKGRIYERIQPNYINKKEIENIEDENV